MRISFLFGLLNFYTISQRISGSPTSVKKKQYYFHKISETLALPRSSLDAIAHVERVTTDWFASNETYSIEPLYSAVLCLAVLCCIMACWCVLMPFLCCYRCRWRSVCFAHMNKVCAWLKYTTQPCANDDETTNERRS